MLEVGQKAYLMPDIKDFQATHKVRGSTQENKEDFKEHSDCKIFNIIHITRSTQRLIYEKISL